MKKLVCLKDGIFLSQKRFVKGDEVKEGDKMYAHVMRRCKIQMPDDKPDQKFSFKMVEEEEKPEAKEETKVPVKKGRAPKSAK